MNNDKVNHPSHYTQDLKVNVECIMFTRNMGFDIGNAFKYVWRAGYKDNVVQDLKKALWYVEDAVKYYKYISDMQHLVDFLPERNLNPYKYDILEALLKGEYYNAHDKLTAWIKKFDAEGNLDESHMADAVRFRVESDTTDGSRLIDSPSADERA